ncbi:hypothetical protein Daus18300_000079 [Diaporthe australafricana]|uniref:NACHT domain-containing protein n=1 Tax=Diaporthe australafricana TaxID=127596 RepID=A0ABR3Y6Q8_9PEZI
MAEAIAALGLAANILQTVEYGGAFVTTAWRIYSSQADANLVKDFDQLRYLTQDFRGILGSLEQSASGVSSTTGLRDRDRDLLRLVANSQRVTEEILDSLDKIGDSTRWKLKKHKAILAAFKLTWNQGHIMKLQSNLEHVRSQLTLHLAHSLRCVTFSRISAIDKSIEINFLVLASGDLLFGKVDAAASRETQEKILRKIAHSVEHLNVRFDQALDLGLGTASVDFVANRIGAERHRNVGESLKLEILSTIYDPSRDDKILEPSTFEIPLARTKTLKERLLSTLAYPDMLVREQSVAKAHEKTFHWIFQSEKQQDRPWASFCQWLEAPDKQLYWITGKAGSGKSTLMRFISQPPATADFSSQPGSPNSEPRCSAFLRRWAGCQPLLVVSFYFWAVGSPMQRSKEGLLRALLHGLLRQVEPAMLASIAPESWEALCLFDENPRPYSEDLLHTTLFRALEFLSASNKICIFIDGLDEFEGEQGDLLGALRDALNAHPIKLCVSSRPWQVFEDAFQDKPSLRLQDLTLADIKAYAHSHLHPDPAFALLRTLEESFADNLVNNIAMKADGVFLWVHLVVASLQKGIKAGDRVSDLQRRLDLLPPDLEALFERMLDDLDPEYLDHAMHYFQLMEASLSILPPNVMVFSYADEEDEAFGAKFPTLPVDTRTFESTRDFMKKRLNSRCMGLLELAEQSEASEGVFVDVSRSRVKYLHRTVRDYIANAKVQEKLNHRARRADHQRFDLHLRLCSAELAFCKTSPIHTALDGERTPMLPDINDSNDPSSNWELTLAAYMIENRKEVWEQVVKLMIKHGAPIRRRHIYKAIRIARSVSTGIPDGDEAICASLEHDLNLMKKEA